MKTCNAKLKPCPFCGSKAKIDVMEVISIKKKYFTPRCTKGSENEAGRKEKGICIGNQGWWLFDTEDEAIKVWNTRQGIAKKK